MACRVRGMEFENEDEAAYFVVCTGNRVRTEWSRQQEAAIAVETYELVQGGRVDLVWTFDAKDVDGVERDDIPWDLAEVRFAEGEVEEVA